MRLLMCSNVLAPLKLYSFVFYHGEIYMIKESEGYTFSTWVLSALVTLH